MPCYRDLSEYDGKIDLGIVVVPPKFVKQAVQDAIDAGAKVVTVITAGFREVSADGAAAEQELVELCQRTACGCKARTASAC